jgi:hypothetical protein
MSEGPFKLGAWVTGQSWHLSGEWQTGFFIGLVRHGDGNSYAQIANATGTDLVIAEALRLAPTPDCPVCAGARVEASEVTQPGLVTEPPPFDRLVAAFSLIAGVANGTAVTVTQRQTLAVAFQGVQRVAKEMQRTRPPDGGDSGERRE